jgi:hypothetical protein
MLIYYVHVLAGNQDSSVGKVTRLWVHGWESGFDSKQGHRFSSSHYDQSHPASYAMVKGSFFLVSNAAGT